MISNKILKYCEICHSELRKQSRLRYDIYQCKSCGLLHADAEIFNLNEGSNLDEINRFAALEGLRKRNFIIVLDELKSQFFGKKDLTGLEVGSAYGWFLKQCRKHEISCIGVEPENKFWPIHADNGLQLIKGCFPESCRSLKQKFDFIAFNDSFEHIPDLKTNLNVCYNLLKQNGILILNLPLSDGFFYNVAKAFYKIGIKQPLSRMWQFEFHSPHCYYFSKSSIARICEVFHFKTVDYFRLETIDYSTISQRVSMNPKNSKLSFPGTIAIYCLKPILHLLKEDVGVFFLKKI